VVNRIRTQLQTFNPNKADFPQTQHWYKQHDSLAMEKEKLDEFATQQHSYINQAQTIEEQVDDLTAQTREQQEMSIPASQPDDEELYDEQETNLNANQEPTNEDVLLFRLIQIQQQLNAVSEERNAIRAKNLGSFKSCAILSRERQLADKENIILRKQRNALQDRLDALEDQGIDIGKPRNDAEADARASRRRQREKGRYEGLAGAMISPALEEADGDAVQEVELETELLDATDEMDGVVEPPLLSPKEKHDIDMLFEEGSDDALSEESNNCSGEEVKQDFQAPTPQQFVSGGFTDDMVYGDENGEDLIDWTPDDEYEFNSYPAVAAPIAVPASRLPIFPAPFSPLQSSSTETPQVVLDYGDSLRSFGQAPDHLDKNQRGAALVELDKPWDDLARPLPPHSLPVPVASQLQFCEENLAYLQNELNQTTQRRDSALTKLESIRRDLATRIAEGKGARLRIKVLEDELSEQQMKEIQLREELRLEREEDPLADKLFLELNELRKQYEMCQDSVAVKEKYWNDLRNGLEEDIKSMKESIQSLQQQLSDAETKTLEANERVKVLEEAAEKGNAYVDELEQKIVVGHGQLNSLTNTVHAREEELKLLNTELAAVKEELELTKDNDASEATATALAGKQQDIRRLNSEVQTLKQELERTRSDLQGCHSTKQKYSTALAASESEVKKLASQLKDVIEERDQARTESRDAVAAAEKARDELVEGKRALGAANDMGHRLRRMSNENIRELVMAKEQRDEAVHDVGRLERDLSMCRDEARRLGKQVKELSEERDDLVIENRVVVRQFRVAMRRAEEAEKGLERCREESEGLKKQIEEKKDAVLGEILGEHESSREGTPDEEEKEDSPLPSPGLFHLVGEEPPSPVKPKPTTPASKPKPTKPAPKAKPSKAVPTEPLRRGTRDTRNPAPRYVDPPSSSPPSPIGFTSLNRRKRKPDVSWTEEMNDGEVARSRREKRK
jgi:hypothetical protein